MTKNLLAFSLFKEHNVMVIGSLVRFVGASANNQTWISAREFVSPGCWRNGITEGELWNAGDVGMIVDMISCNHRKAIVMRNNKYFEIALKHLETCSKTTLKRKKEVKETDGQEEEKE